MGKLKAGPTRRQGISAALLVLGAAAWAGLAITMQSALAGAPTSTTQAPPATGAASTPKAAPTAPVKLVDINSASRAELKTLPGVGDAEADKIIAGRPYLSKAHLVTDAGLPIGTYQSIRHQIVAVQNKAAKAKFKTLAGTPPAQPR